MDDQPPFFICSNNLSELVSRIYIRTNSLFTKASSPFRLSSMKPGSKIPSSARNGSNLVIALPGKLGTTTYK